MKRYVHKLVSEALGNMYQNGQLFALPSFELEIPKENFGDFTTSVAFEIARGGKYNPNQVAEILAREIKLLDKSGYISEIKVAGGFINFFISAQRLAEYALGLSKKIDIDQIGLKSDGKPKKVVFEYSSPNTNKPLHIGHTRNDLFGMACVRLLRATGHKVISCEIINDRGVHIMKSMLMYMRHGAGKTPQSEKLKPDHFVGQYYAMFAEEAQTNPELEQEAQALLVKWEAGDKNLRKLWKQMNEWFFEGVEQTYKQEGSEFDEVQYESDFYDKGRDLVLEGAKKGVFEKQSDGSIIVDLSGQGLDKKILLRNDGTTLYITQDMHLWDWRFNKHHPDLLVCTTSSEQAYHFSVLKYIFQKLGFEWAENFTHLPYEHVYLGKNKMSSRAGNTVSADDLLNMIKNRVRETMKTSQKIKASAEDQQLVSAIAFGAIKYGYLKYDRNTKIFFDLDETIAIEGNTGPYIQYTYARIQSISQQAGKIRAPKNLDLLSDPLELGLMRMLVHYNQAVVAAAKDFKPNTVCNYLYELAAKFNVFYDKLSVLKAESEDLKQQRLALIGSVAKVLEYGLNLLGIEAVDKM